MRIVEIFKGSKIAEMYLFVDKKEGLTNVPEKLLKEFGMLESVMVIPLDRERFLARVSASKVLDSLEMKGFFVQMPPAREASVDTQISAIFNAEPELDNAQNREPNY